MSSPFLSRVPLHSEKRLTLAQNVQQSLPLIQPLLGLLTSEDDVPYPQITHALSTLLASLPFESLRAMGLYTVMQQGLHSSIPDIQLLALEQAQKMTEVDDVMVSSLIECLSAEDARVGKKAVDVITTVSPPYNKTDYSYSLMTPFKHNFYDSLKFQGRLSKFHDSST
jgi:hypothetical protein